MRRGGLNGKITESNVSIRINARQNRTNRFGLFVLIAPSQLPPFDRGFAILVQFEVDQDDV